MPEHGRKTTKAAGRPLAPAKRADAASRKEKILDAAEAEFAHRGFEGARIDTIAQAAGVNKALIYYYFKNKRALLEELIQRLLVLVTAEKEGAYTTLRPGDADFLDAVIRRTTRTLQERLPIFTVLCMEALKDDHHNPALLRVFDKMVKAGIDQAERHGYSLVWREESRVPAFFFEALPLLFFVLLKGAWASHYKVDEAGLEEEFFHHFASVYRSWGSVVLRKRK
jgi:AcrR family transcriptional regulator